MLEIMGVPDWVCKQHPSANPRTSYPKVFRSSPELRLVWERLCLESADNVRNYEPAVAWNAVLRRFLRWAHMSARNVWPAEVTRADNNAIQSFLLLRRRWITQYLDSLKVLQAVKWLTVDQSVTEDRLGFTVNSSLNCRQVDYAGLKQMFESQRWRPNLQSRVGYGMGYRDWWRWIKVSETGVTRVGFSAAGSERGNFWYSIVVPTHPLVPECQSTESFVLKTLWAPVVRTLRFTTMSRINTF